jgi:hypothetical protein
MCKASEAQACGVGGCGISRAAALSVAVWGPIAYPRRRRAPEWDFHHLELTAEDGPGELSNQARVGNLRISTETV